MHIYLCFTGNMRYNGGSNPEVGQFPSGAAEQEGGMNEWKKYLPACRLPHLIRKYSGQRQIWPGIVRSW